jgi:hypothetical protein
MEDCEPHGEGGGDEKESVECFATGGSTRVGEFVLGKKWWGALSPCPARPKVRKRWIEQLSRSGSDLDVKGGGAAALIIIARGAADPPLVSRRVRIIG